MPSVIYRDPKIKINAVVYKDTTVRVKKLVVGTPVKRVTSGAFNIDNLSGVSTTGKTAGSILAYNASDTKWSTTNFATGNNISITFDSAANTFTFGTNAALTNVTSLDATTTSTVRGVLSVTDAGGDGSLAYNNSTGVVTYTGPSASETRAHVSAVDGGGDGSFTYNSGTGAFTYTGPSAAEVRAHITANKGLNISSGELNIDSANVKGMFSGGTGVTYNNGVISIGQPVATSSDVTFNDVVISGDLTVSGTQTTVNTETLLLADNVIVVNSNATGTPSENGGIEVERGDATNKTLIWNESIDKWTVGSETFVAGTFEGNLTGNVTGTVSSISNHTTANLTENTNLYHTTARARGAVSASGDLSYNSSTGVFSIDVEDAYTKVNFDSDLSAANTGQLPEGSNLYHTTARARGAVSVTDAGGDGSLSYNSSTGVITYTGASAAEVRAHFSAGGDLSYNSSTGQFSFDVESVYTKANFDSDLGIANTGQLPEGSNLYYTNARADARITTASVTATGALMDSELTDLAGVKGVTISTLQPKPSEGAFANGDKTKLDAIESGATADQTDAEIRTAVESATNSNVFTDADHSKLNAIEASATADQTDAEIKTAYENNSDTNAFTDAEKTKLSNIEASADVTDTANVTSAGALMDSEVTDLAGVKGVTISTLQVKPTEGAFADGDKTKLDGIEASADVTDTANVTSAGALMDSELTDLAGVKGVTISTLQPKPSEGAFANGDKTKLDGIEASADVTDTANVTAAGALMDSELTDLAGVKGVTISTLQVKPSEGAFANGDKTKLDGIEASADVTDTANVTSAGALMDSELTSIADVKALDQSVISGASPNFTTTNMSDATNKRFMTDAQESKLDGIEASATADQTDAEIRAAVEAATDSNVFTDADHSKLNAIEASADVTDTANVTAAGALMDSEVDADIKTLSLPANTTISAFGKTLVDDADAATARTTLGIDASGTDNSTNVTLAGSLDYITISGQEITRNAINLSTDVTGTLPISNMAATALTTVQTAANESAHLALTAQEGDVVVRSDQNKTYMHNGGSAGTMNDYTLLATPTDAVTSVNGNTGVVTVTENVTTNLTITGTDAARTIVSSDGTNAVIPVATDSVSGVMSAADHTKLSGIETSADVTDTANVTSAGALMDSELTDLAGVKGVTISTLQVKPSEGAFVNGDKTKLDAIEASADVTDTANVTSAGALMDSELTSIADVKALDQSVVSGASPTFATTNMTDASNKRFMTDAQETKLDSVESSADVTDTANVTAAGALMDSELTDLAGVKGVTISTLQPKPSEGAFANGDKTKLDGIEASADVTDTANVTAAGALMDSELTDLAGVKGVTISTLQVKPSEGAFADGDKTKLDAIEASADVTDTANVTAAGALMDSELTDLAGVKGVTISTLQPKPSEGAFANGDKTKLDGIEASADVTDTANVTSAGALMDSELTSIANVKALDQSVVSGASPTFGTANMTDASNKRFMTDAQETKLDSVESSATADQTAAEILTAIKTVDGASSGLDADLLDGVQGASYLRSDANDTFTGDLTVAGTLQVEGATGETIRLHRDDTTVTGGNLIGQIAFSHNDDTNSGDGVLIKGIANGGTGNSTLQIHTGTPGSLTEKIRISDSKVENKVDLEVTGAITATSHLDMPDNAKIKLGTGDDLEIYHDGSNSYISDTGTGDIIIKGQYVRLQDEVGTNLLTADGNDAVSLYYGGAAKLATLSGGINVTGTVTSDALTVDTTASNGATINAHDNATTTYPLKISNAAGSGNLELGTYGINNNIDLKLQRGGSTKLTVTSSGVDVTGNVTATGALKTTAAGTGQQLFNATVDLGTNTRGFSLVSPASDSGSTAFKWETGNSILWELDTAEAKSMFLNSAGNLGLGTYSQSVKLDVNGTIKYTGLRGTGAVTVTNILDEDNMASNSATALATQQSIKAYVDANSGSGSATTDASELTSGIIPAARVAHNTFDIGDTTAETGRNVHETGLYTYNVNNASLGNSTPASYYSVLGFGQGAGGSAQFATNWVSNGNELYFRSLRDTTDDWWDWKEIWHEGNDGSGSGLDADTLDGLQGASYLRSDADDAVNAYSTQITFPSNTSGASTSGDQASLEVRQSTGNSDAFMQFHIAGDYAGYFGLDGTTNDLFVGGWSYGANKHKIWHAGNDGSGSGLDADLVDGLQVHTGRNNVANQIVRTDGSGYAQMGWINTTSGATSTTITRMYMGDNDGYIRYMSPANFFNQQASALLTAVKTVDGSGSGLDADTLDGVQGASYLRSDASDTFTGTLSVVGAMSIENTGGYANLEMGGPSGAFIDLKKPNSDDYDFRIIYDDTASLKTTGNYVSVSTASGYVHIGPQNTSYSHFSTDRAKFYFNKQINVDTGIITSHNEDLKLQRAGSTTNQLLIASGSATFGVELNAPSLKLTSGGDASLSSTAHVLQLGPTSGTNMALDGNEIMARNNGAASSLIFQNDGGNISACAGGGTTTFGGNLVIPNIIYHAGDTNTYLQFQTADQFRVVTGGVERLEVNNSAVTVSGVLSVGAAIDLIDNKVLRFGSSDDVEFFFSGSHMYTDLNTGDWYIRDGTTNRFLFNDNGDFHADANIFAYSTSVGSDRKLKDNIEVIESPLEKIQKLNGVTFNWKRDGEASAGVIAQDVQKVLPSAVKEVKQLSNEGEDSTRLNVDYNQIIGLLVESVKELKKEIEELKKGK